MQGTWQSQERLFELHTEPEKQEMDEAAYLKAERLRIKKNVTSLYINSQSRNRTIVGQMFWSECRYNTSTIKTILDSLVPRVTKRIPGVTQIHYWTDISPAQYCNKTIFSLVSDHHVIFDGILQMELFRVRGHGKGPCHGVGGTIPWNGWPITPLFKMLTIWRFLHLGDLRAWEHGNRVLFCE